MTEQIQYFLAQLPTHWSFWLPVQPSHAPPVCWNVTMCQLRSEAVTSTSGDPATALKGVTRVDRREDYSNG